MTPSHRSFSRVASVLAALAIALVAVAPSFAAATQVVNVNEASAEQLALLPRVGPSVAQRIVEFREQNGRFKTLEDLMLVRGIGERTFESLRPYLTLSGPTTLDSKVKLPRASEASQG